MTFGKIGINEFFFLKQFRKRFPTPRRLFKSDPLMSDLSDAIDEFLDIDQKLVVKIRDDFYFRVKIQVRNGQ